MIRRPIVLAALILAPFVTACHGSSASATSQGADVAPKVAVVGKLAPTFDEKTVDGSMLSLASLRGKAVYLNFFASWCPPCNEEASEVSAVQQEFAARGLQVVGVDVLENPEKAKQFVASHHLVYPALADDGTLRDAYSINGLPVHAFIDRNGIVRKIYIGELDKSQMEADVKMIL